MYPIIRVTSRNADALEPLGTKRKFWYRNGEMRMLLKLEERGTGEDWAEKVACELCVLLGLPHVQYDLAHDESRDVPAVVCASCVPKGWVMGLGNQMLQALDPQYPDGNRYKVRTHTPEAVSNVLHLLLPPPTPYSEGVPHGIDTAAAVFTGYILLDAWIGNQDRHHENWAVLRSPGHLTAANLFLAPTFDHGASLARQLTDKERQARIATGDMGYQVPSFARKARSAFYANPVAKKSMTTVAAWHAFSRMTPPAATIWIERLRMIEAVAVRRVIEQVPAHRMSEVSREFTLQLLMENQRRLLAGEE